MYLVDSDGSNVMRLPGGTGQDDQFPNWSPDGDKLSFSSFSSFGFNSREIYLMDDDGSNHVQLTRDEIHNDLADWSPDSKHLVFVSGQGSEAEIHVVRVGGLNRTQLTDNSYADYAPAWSPMGVSGN